jgi:hypothetical protein
LEDGAITLTTIGLLTAHLTEENHEPVLASATHKSKRQIEELVAALKPQPPVPAVVRKLPSAAASTPPQSRQVMVAAADPEQAPIADVNRVRLPQIPSVSPAKPAIIAPLSPARYKLQLTMSKETHDKLRRVQDLMRHTNPSGDVTVIFDRAITTLLNTLEKAKLGATDRPHRTTRAPSQGSRHIPAAVKREVSKRDGRRCAFVGDAGRCTETGSLEYHHVVPFAEGGAAIASNIQLRCRAHNAYEGEQWFGPLIARETPSPYGFSDWFRPEPSRARRRASQQKCRARAARPPARSARRTSPG